MMRTLIVILFALTIATIAFSQDCETVKAEKSVKEQLEIKTDVPNYLKGATITVRRSDGKESTVPAEQFKVVPRKQQFIVTHDLEATHLLCKGADYKNRVSALGGVAPNGKLSAAQVGTTAVVESQYGAVGGLQYQRKLGDRFSVGAQVQTNQSALGILGFDF